jgi:hypothetical protein
MQPARSQLQSEQIQNKTMNNKNYNNNNINEWEAWALYYRSYFLKWRAFLHKTT